MTDNNYLRIKNTRRNTPAASDDDIDVHNDAAINIKNVEQREVSLYGQAVDIQLKSIHRVTLMQ